MKSMIYLTPAILGWMENVFNEEKSMRKYRLLPYFVLPLSMALMLFRFFQAALSLWNGKTDRLIESHEVEKESKDSHQLLDKD